MKNIIDLTGKKFGKWTVIERAGVNAFNQPTWLCKCECGTERIVDGRNLVRGLSKTCGCSRKNRDVKFEDLSGQKFGKLTVLKLDHKELKVKKEPTKGYVYCYLCQCECGNLVIVRGNNLKTGQVKSCGCLFKEFNATKGVHRLCNTRLYRTWNNMRHRCYFPKNTMYKYYGGRGITICDEWLNDFMSFYNWALANGYKENLTIDRINNNGNYEPNNCRWITMSEQNKNKRPRGTC